MKPKLDLFIPEIEAKVPVQARIPKSLYEAAAKKMARNKKKRKLKWSTLLTALIRNYVND